MENSDSKNQDKESRSSKIEHRTTPAIKQMLATLAEKGYRSPARENERLIIEAYQKL